MFQCWFCILESASTRDASRPCCPCYYFYRDKEHRRRAPGPLHHSRATQACGSRCAGRPPASPRASRARQARSLAMARAPPPCLLDVLAPRSASPVEGGLDALSELVPPDASSLVRALSEPTYQHLLPSADAPSELTRASTTLPVTLLQSSRHSVSGCQDVTQVPSDISLMWTNGTFSGRYTPT